MKLILFLLLLFPLNCKAEERYSDYYFYEETENYYEETDLLKREENKIYVNYKNEVSEEGYYALDEESNNLSYLDEENYIIIDDEESNKSTHLYINGYEYIKYIKLLNFNGDLTKINYFLTRNDDQTAAWDLQHINCYLKEIVKPESIILLKLRNTYYYEKFKMTVAILSTSETDFSFDLGISEDNITYKYFHINISNENLNNEHIFYLTNNEEEAGLKYDKKIILYRYYNLEKIYTDTFTEKPLLDHYHDTDQFKTIYTYYKRDLLTDETRLNNEKIKIENKEKEDLIPATENNLLEPIINTDILLKEKIIEEGSALPSNEQLKLKNTTKNEKNKNNSIIEKINNEETEEEKEKNKLNFNLFLIFASLTIIKSILKKKKII